jgi:hypothetical protein
MELPLRQWKRPNTVRATFCCSRRTRRRCSAAATWDGFVLALLLLVTAVAIGFAVLFLQYRRRLHAEQGRARGGVIPIIELHEFDDVFAQTSLGPTLAAEVWFVGSGAGVPGGTTDREAWVLAALAKGRRTLFEFGTATGKTTYLLARNSPPDARVHTITLPPSDLDSYDGDDGDSGSAQRKAIAESSFTSFLYTGTPVEGKVDQLFGDSKALDVSEWLGKCDLVFVDGSHAFSYVMSDSRKALSMVTPGGLVIWHDYQPLRRAARDVCRALDQLAGELPLVRLNRTAFVVYRAPADPGPARS